MRIVNDEDLRVGLGQNSSAKTIGMVVKTPEETGVPGQLGLYIPKFMTGLTLKDGEVAKEESISISNSKCKNASGTSSFLSGSVTIKNYVTVRPLLNQNQDIAQYVVGDKVFVEIVDDDIKTLLYLPYSFNKLGQRAVDIARFLVPANPEINTELTDENTYYLLLDSINKKVELSTSENNKEACTHTLTMDAENGILTITDNQDRTIEISTNDDQIKMTTSGATITMAGDQVTIDADTINFNGSSNINMKTETLNIEADTIKSSASNVQYEYDNFKQTSQAGQYQIDSEKHQGNATSFAGSTFHVDMPIIGLNGQVVFPNFAVGAVPDINVPVNPINGISGMAGSMSIQTDPAGVPLAKAPPLLACLTAIAAAADAYPCGGGAASAAVAAAAASLSTTKILSS